MWQSYNPLYWVGLMDYEELEANLEPIQSVGGSAGSTTWTSDGACPLLPFVPIPMEFQLVFCFFSMISVFLQVIILCKMERVLLEESRSTSIPKAPATGETAPNIRVKSIYKLPSLRKSLRVLFRSRQESLVDGFKAGRQWESAKSDVYLTTDGDAGGQRRLTDAAAVIPESVYVPRFLTLHQFRRGVEAPAEVDALRIESVMRILDLKHKVQFDASENSGFWLSRGGATVAAGSTHCLGYLKSLTLKSASEWDWDIPAQFAIQGQFALSHLKGEFPALVTIFKRGYWKGIDSNEVSKKTMSPSELELVGAMDKDQILDEIKKALTAFQASLGRQNFLVGNILTVADGFAFAILAQMAWTRNADLHGLIKEYPDLLTYTNRIRSIIWDDWTPPSLCNGDLSDDLACPDFSRDSYDQNGNKRFQTASGTEQRNQRSMSTRTFPILNTDTPL